MRAKVRLNTPEEEAAIQRGIDQDPDNLELDDAFFANAQPAREVMPLEVYDELVERQRRRRGPGKKPAKQLVSLRLDRDVVERWRASGPGWQARVNEALRRHNQRRG
jgi:uncharacterized protein (DUF4415 family)